MFHPGWPPRTVWAEKPRNPQAIRQRPPEVGLGPSDTMRHLLCLITSLKSTLAISGEASARVPFLRPKYSSKTPSILATGTRNRFYFASVPETDQAHALPSRIRAWSAPGPGQWHRYYGRWPTHGCIAVCIIGPVQETDSTLEGECGRTTPLTALVARWPVF